MGAPVPLAELTLFQKRIQGSLFGASNPRRTSRRCSSCTATGNLKLDELVTTTYKLDEINQGYEDMHAGKNIRGVILY